MENRIEEIFALDLKLKDKWGNKIPAKEIKFSVWSSDKGKTFNFTPKNPVDAFMVKIFPEFEVFQKQCIKKWKERFKPICSN